MTETRNAAPWQERRGVGLDRKSVCINAAVIGYLVEEVKPWHGLALMLRRSGETGAFMHAPDHDSLDHVEVDPSSPALKQLDDIARAEGRGDAAASASGEFHYYRKHLMTLAVSRCRELTGNAAKVMLRVVSYANKRTGWAWMSIATLSDETGFSRKVVKAAISDAESCGLLKVERSEGGHHGDTNLYRPAWNLAVEERGPQRDRVRGPYRDWVDAETEAARAADGVPAGKGRGPYRDPNQSDYQLEGEESSYAPARKPAAVPDELTRRRPEMISAEKVPLPAEFRFSEKAIAAAKAAPRSLSDADIARAGPAFRRKAGDDLDTLARWQTRGDAYLAAVEAKPVRDELVRIGDPMTGGRICKPSEVKPWESCHDSSGALHRGRLAPPVNSAGSRYAL